MAFYKTQDINKEVTLFVKQYLDNGYWFYLTEMNTLYSDAEGTIWITNGIEDVRVQLKKEISKRVWGSEDSRYIKADCIHIEIKRSEHSENHFRYTGKLIGIETVKTFYELKEGKYTDQLDVYVEIKNRQRDKRNNKPYSFNSNTIKELKHYDADKIIKIVNQRQGYKSCRKSQIERVERYKDHWSSCCYRIYIKGKNRPIFICNKRSFERY